MRRSVRSTYSSERPVSRASVRTTLARSFAGSRRPAASAVRYGPAAKASASCLTLLSRPLTLPWKWAIAAYVGRKFRHDSSHRCWPKSWVPKSRTLDTSTMPFSISACFCCSRSATATARTVP